MHIPAVNPNAVTVSSFSSQSIEDWSSKSSLKNTVAAGVASPSTKYTAYVPFKDSSDYTTGATHRSNLLNSADDILTKLTERLGMVEASVKKDRPDIANKSWDFGVKNGKVVVTGDDLTADEKKWLESKIYKDKFLSTAASGYISKASSYLETTAVNPAYLSQNSATRKDVYYNFRDVKNTLESGIGFRALVKELHSTYDTGFGGDTTGYGSAGKSFDYLAAKVLSATPSGA